MVNNRQDANGTYLSLGSISFVLFRGIYYKTPDHYSLSEKLVAALIATGECGDETIADNNSKQLKTDTGYRIPSMK